MQGRTKVEDVYQALKDDICVGRLPPGQRLNLGALCKEHEVSLSVVREAVTRLASERLLQATPQRGFQVWPLSVPDLLDLTRVRIEIDSLAVRESIMRGDLAWEAELVAAHHRLVGAASDAPSSSGGPSYRWMKAHNEFHAVMASACTSPLLKRLRQQLFDASEIYRYWSAAPAKRANRRVHKEHQALLDAALAHDADRGVELLAAHIQQTTDLLLECAEKSAVNPA